MASVAGSGNIVSTLVSLVGGAIRSLAGPAEAEPGAALGATTGGKIAGNQKQVYLQYTKL
jgi:hypothetical protein